MSTHRPCPREGCPGLEMHEGKPDGCGHPTITEGCMGLLALERDRLRLGFDALAMLVREEYQGVCSSLSEIAGTWRPTYSGEITDEHIAALRELEGT